MTSAYPYALTAQRYRDVLAQDFTRMRSLVEEAGDRPVPTCPGWTADDVVRHTAQVYLHKAESIRLGEMPREGWPPEHVRTAEPGPLLDDAYRQLVGQLDAHDPADHAATWWPPDETVGFWLRRMAHETSIHRRDVESAVDAVTPVAQDLAVDGIDEVLELMLAGDWSDEVVPEASGATVAVEGGGHCWAVTLEPAQVTLERHAPGSPAARVTGEPGEVLLWLWGRGPRPSVDGDEGAVTELRDRLQRATQ
jgi:uncharacterized protein (TIGR03083 family)